MASSDKKADPTATTPTPSSEAEILARANAASDKPVPDVTPVGRAAATDVANATPDVKKQHAEDKKNLDKARADRRKELTEKEQVFGTVTLTLGGSFASAGLGQLDAKGKPYAGGKDFVMEFVHSSKTDLNEALLALRNYVGTLQNLIGAAATKIVEANAAVDKEKQRVEDLKTFQATQPSSRKKKKK